MGNAHDWIGPRSRQGEHPINKGKLTPNTNNASKYRDFCALDLRHEWHNEGISYQWCGWSCRDSHNCQSLNLLRWLIDLIEIGIDLWDGTRPCPGFFLGGGLILPKQTFSENSHFLCKSGLLPNPLFSDVSAVKPVHLWKWKNLWIALFYLSPFSLFFSPQKSI